MSAFDTARDIRLPGVVIERVYVDPKLLTTRMKSAVKKMLREGHAHGGWNSKSKALALKLAECNHVMVVGSVGWGFTAPPRHTYGDDTVAEVLALIDADEALELIHDGEVYNSQYVENVRAKTRASHERRRNIVRSSADFRWLGSSHNKEIMFQMIDAFVKTRSAAQIEAAEKLCDRIDAGDPIEISISH